MIDHRRVSMVVNGQPVERDVETRRLLVDFLREDLGLLGVHIGCEHGICGTCTVLMNAETMRSCITFAVQADGQEITTVEALSQGGTLHRLQEAFWEQQGLQCGYCTPAMMLRALEILRETPNPTREAVREGLASQLCRCTGYQFIVDVAVVTGAEAAELCNPMPDFGPAPDKHVWRCLAREKVRYVGESVAAVVAESRYIAEDALDLIEVEYDPIAPVEDPEPVALTTTAWEGHPDTPGGYAGR